MKHVLATSVLCVTIGLVAAGCGGSDPSSAAPSSGNAEAAQPAGGRMPGGSGKVTEVSGSTAQVQGNDSQVAVSWTGSTTFTTQVSTDAAAVTVGSCVMVTSDEQGASTTKVAAASVRITKATGGTCTLGRPGVAGRPSGEANRPRPTDLPSGVPSGAPGGRFGGFAIGKVTAVSDSGFTVASSRLGSDDSTTSVSVMTSGSTTYTTTKAGTAAEVKVGACLTSRGKADDTGAIAATTIEVTQPVEGECGFGGFGGRGAGRS
ncbi:hypothetical protein [Aeromicrobium ginsengisoli]|uniref:hypothetical protein n=1 Tax=Aeromicrobium ginsengisoli TaxID=363867 RepID=UPI00165FC3DA|nr:hypothetical protein [Aeromicrobium ginsengisoli]